MINKTQILDSLAFLSIARSVIRDSIELSNIKEKKDLKRFITNEATDYEIMSLLVLGELPKEKYNAVYENELWDIFKRQAVRSSSILSESLSPGTIENLIFEVGPVSGLGLSSAKSILEFQYQMGMLNEFKLSGLGQMRKDLTQMGHGIAGFAKKSRERYSAGRQQIAKNATQSSLAAKGKELGTKGIAAAKSGLEKIGDISGASGIGAKIGASPAMAGLGVLGIASLLGYGAYKTYQRFFSKAAKACSKFSGGQKSQCMKNFKINAMKAQIADLSKGSAACGQSSDPAKCKLLANKRMQKIKDQIAKLSIAT